MKFFQAVGLGLTLVVLAACSGGTGSSVAPIAKSPVTTPGSAAPQVATTRVKAIIHIPKNKKTSNTKKGRNYVSPSTNGLIIAVYTILNHQNVTLNSVTGYDLSTSSTTTTCVDNPQESVRDCTIYLNAPATSSSSQDDFFLYAYDKAEPTTISDASSVVGNLLSQDNGLGAGDVIPNSSNPNGVSATGNNVLTFTLNGVVAEVAAAIPAYNVPDSPVGTNGPVVISAAGTGGTSNTVNIYGYDADLSQIVNYSQNTDLYASPIALSLTPSTSGSQFTFDGTDTTLNITSPINYAVAPIYAPGPNDAPTSPSATVPYATLNISAPFTGGYDNNITYPTSTTTPTPITIAPLFAYVPPTATNGLGVYSNQYESDNMPSHVRHISGSAKHAYDTYPDYSQTLSNYVYAMQYEQPTQAGYNLSANTTTTNTNDCTEYEIHGPYTDVNAASDPSVQDVWEVDIVSPFPSPNTTCQLTLSDGFSSQSITLTQNDTTTASSASVTVPTSITQPVMPVTTSLSDSTPFTYPANGASATVGDTIVCIEGFQGSGTSIGVGSDTEGTLNYDYSQEPATTGSGQQGIVLAAYDVVSPSDTLTSYGYAGLSDPDSGLASPVYCGEYQNTSADAIFQQTNFGFTDRGQVSTFNNTVQAPELTPPTAGDGAIVALSYSGQQSPFTEQGWTGNSNSTQSTGLYVQSITNVIPNTNYLPTNISSAQAANVYAALSVLIPIGPSAHAQFNTFAKHRHAVIHAR